ncbi:MAG: 5-deoxy-glucuronate isomerase [Flavobacteriales bacterium]|jgi:5-deoxy-glucuronate isomerase|nr:5-deoxy-glucuronate isomerase [Flavobacteriales bacterium]|tara:strand:- start:447 stop:1334 length:888 start_codon:yes stop_codon:yes gene_type:complete
MKENNSHLLIKPKLNSSVYQSITKESVGWKYLNFEARKLNFNEEFIWDTFENEMVVVLLSGNYKFKSNYQNFEITNGREDVFKGVAHTLYIPRRTQISITATSKELDIAYGWCKSDMDYPMKLIKPEETQIVIFGGDNATRQFNDLIPPGFGCSKIVVREVYTPSGNWSSFPAHKHDERVVDSKGKVLEPIQEETYFYKFQKPEAYAIQQVYTKDKSLDEIIRAKNNDVVIIPKGFHPVVAEHGFHCYYLNFLAGTDQCLANTTDPDHEWIYNSWKTKDKRLPLVTPQMNNENII